MAQENPAAAQLFDENPVLAPATVAVRAFLPAIAEFLAEEMEAGIVVFNAGGGVASANALARELLSDSLDKLALADWPAEFGLHEAGKSRLLAPDQTPAARALRGETVRRESIWMRRAEESEGRWLHASALPLAAGGNVAGALLVVADWSDKRNLQRQILETSAREQRCIGQELHDGVCQILTGIKFSASVLSRELSSRRLPEAETLADLERLIEKALFQADSAARGYYPVELESGGLVSALREFAAQTRKLYRVACQLIAEPGVKIRDAEVSGQVFRIAQEAVTNAVKRGRSRNVGIWLARAQDRYSLMVRDDSRDSPEPPRRHGMGWRIMHQRADTIGASLRIERTPDAGNALICEFQDRTP